jgi:dihydropteroate synthase
MGILNVTPDSFSDGGTFIASSAAIAHAKQMVADGCDIVDVGGESTRPGATPLDTPRELARIEPILTELASTLDAAVSIDTYKAKVAARAVELGAVLVNDVWGLQKDPEMADVVAAAEAAVVIMHNRAEKDASIDILTDIRRSFDRSLALANKAGIRSDRIILDPGIGFAKTSHQNRDAIARLAELKDYALPIMVGVSRKTFLGGLGDGSEGSLFGTIAVNLAAAANGASIFRVHDVGPNRAALNVFHAIALR